MKDVVVRTGSSVAAAAVAYLGLTLLTENLPVTGKVAVSVALGILAFAAAAWASPSVASPPEATAEVASDLKGRSVEIEDLHIEAPQGPVRLASGIEAEGHIEIRRTGVSSRGEREK